MAILALNKLSLAYLEKEVLSDCTLTLEAGSKTGLTGRNGAGKTSLFRLLSGEISPTSGEIIMPRGLKVGIMEQELKHTGRTLHSELLSVFRPLIELSRQIDQINFRLSQPFNDEAARQALLEQQYTLNEEFIARGGLTYESRVNSSLLGLGFTRDDFDRPLEQLSGGQRSKLALARLLLSEADLLLLDEPTNHLDVTALEWLEDFLRSLNTAFIVISHDRFFLDRVTEQTIHLENHHMKLYKGSYTEFRRQYQAEREAAMRHNANVSREISRMEGIIKQQKQWNREKTLIMAHSKEKALERLKGELIELEQQQAGLDFRFPAAPASGNDLLTLRDTAKSFGERTLFSGLQMQLHKGEKVCLLGANGAGKTTIFRLITGELTPDAGSVTRGSGLRLGYYDQLQKLEESGDTILDDLRNTFPRLTETRLRGALAAFLFPAEVLDKPCSVLSGGEKARLGLLKILLAEPNLLLLDEPTNHLDIDGREALEQALQSYDGAVLAISHDRYFINALAERVLTLQDGTLTSYCGNYSYYLEKRTEQTTIPAAATAPAREMTANKQDFLAQKEAAANRRKLQSKIERLEADIARHEEKIAALEQTLADPAVAMDYQKAAAIDQELQQAQADLEQIMQEWETAMTALEEA
ncbi:MAG: ABC-F family ATP-binding cassette domain-containing protein [Firmicutes bacterium]|nr:ABC-F family ATP-binding cassette domain-containing protein [Bacillota bacterium]